MASRNWCEYGRKSPSASHQIKQKIESKLSFFIFFGASNFINKLSRTGN